MRPGPIIDMTPDGKFVTPAPSARAANAAPSLMTVLARLAAFAVLVGVAAVAFWAALFIIPLLILLGAAAYAVLRLFGPRGGLTIRRF